MKNLFTNDNLKNSILLVIDMQDKLLAAVNGSEKQTVLKNTNLLLKCAEIYSMPVLMTEQYPAGLGNTTSDLFYSDRNTFIFEKIHFSIMKDEKIKDKISELNFKNVIIAGIESHICVMQSALELKSQGFNVFICSDAVASRSDYFKQEALAFFRSHDITVCPSESIVYMLLEKAGTSEFKSILPYVK